MLKELHNFGFGDGKSPDYVYTTGLGWIDLQHFFNTAYSTRALGGGAAAEYFVGLGGEAVELLQLIGNIPDLIVVAATFGNYEIDGLASSVFTFEDLPSNDAGRAFGRYLSVGAGMPKISDQLSQFFQQAGATTPNSAPDWLTLPQNEKAHEAEFRHERRVFLAGAVIGGSLVAGLEVALGVATLLSLEA